MKVKHRLAAEFALALAVPTTAHAASDPFFGGWRLDKARSTIDHDPGVKSKEIVFAPMPGGGEITETLEMLSGEGGRQVSRLTYVYGRFTPQPRTDLDAFEVTKSGARRMFWTARLKGRPMARLRVDLSPDGNTMTFRYLFAASDSTGAVTKDRYVYRRE